ncbi:FtsX-like permease family protein [Chitinophaga sp. Mgbs1]|uniref:FtsX-like permease family protein n=1 Tax=Chitinophaga solisilvae TaxID=1233460 RepID=A0A3S1B3W9_9BACT|nr:FtsX-like permease family protein [Chitinophaga solisilvae]
MINSYIKAASRNLIRNSIYSTINITGLSVGIAVCLLIFLIIRFETGYDSFHTKKDRLYRITTVMAQPNGTDAHEPAVSFPLPGVVQQEIPQIEKMSPVVHLQDMQLLLPEPQSLVRKTFKQKTGVYAVAPAFFEMFDFPWLAGSPSVLKDRNAVVLTKETAIRFFGDWKMAIDRQIQLGLDMHARVAGIVDMPPNTEFGFKILMPYAATPFVQATNWGPLEQGYECYVLLPAGTNVAAVDRQLAALARKYLPETLKNFFVLQPLSDIHFSDTIANTGGHGITLDRIRAMWCIAIFILLIACVNFVNLSTAQIMKRSREAGVRKILGSSNVQLKMQFFVETFTLVAASCLLAVLLTSVCINPLSLMLDIPLPVAVVYQPATGYFLLGVLVAVTLAAGFYPALVISGVNPLNTLKQRWQTALPGGLSLRKLLVVFQFMVAQVLIIATILIIKQMSYFKTASMGFNKELIVNVPVPGDSAGLNRMDLLHDRLLSLKQVREVSFNAAPPANDGNWWTDFNFNNAKENTKFATIHKAIDTAYLPLYQIELAAGRNVTASNSIREFIINETVVKKLGFHSPEEVLNKPISMWNGEMKGTIVGVVKDFHPLSLKEEVPPVLLFNFKDACRNASIRLDAGNLPEGLRGIEKIWESVFPAHPFEYQFMDEVIAGFYRREAQLSFLYQLFAGIAIFLSCLGLYGLASWMAVQRTREVGIRKVLGATVSSIVMLFSREFVWLVSIAFLLAAPVAWYFLREWLQSFASSTTLSWWVFACGGVAALSIALITVSYHAVRAALANPVKSLQQQ